MERIASCACSSVSLRVTGEPVAHSVCHCNNCKKRTGSAFGVGAYFPVHAVLRIDGPTIEYAFHNAARNEDQTRHFCARCGTTLYWKISSLPGVLGIAGGCFADNPLGEPDITASHSKKWDWVSIPEHWRVWPET
jgi:hypothetical protein